MERSGKSISVGQELFFDYGEIYWRAHRGKKISEATRTHVEGEPSPTFLVAFR